MNSGFAGIWGESIALLPHVREYKTVLDSGFHAVDSGFQSLASRIPPSKFPRFQIKQAKKISGFRIWIHLHGTTRALGFRQIHLLSFSSQRSRTISREYSQIISTSRWVKKVELYTSRDRGFSNSTCLTCLTCTPGLTANASKSVL